VKDGEQPSQDSAHRRDLRGRRTMSDEDLARQSAAGDEEAYETLVARYARPLYNAAFRMLGDSDDAADAAQEALVQLYVALPRARLDLLLRPWLFRVCRNRCLDLLRRKRALPFSAFSSEDDSPSPVENVADNQPLPEEVFARRDLQATLGAAIASLPVHDRNVVALRYTTDLTFGEIAGILNLPENTVKTHFHCAKALLRRFLVKRGIGADSQRWAQRRGSVGAVAVDGTSRRSLPMPLTA
jgi:RNA polymerase sigma-70 factor (ECF subfamily)